MEITLPIFARPPLDHSMRAYNELMLIMPSGAFADIDGARLAPDGYLEFVCDFCQDGPIVATMVENDAESVHAVRDGVHRLAVRSLTDGAHVAVGELVLCPACNVRNPRREVAA